MSRDDDGCVAMTLTGGVIIVLVIWICWECHLSGIRNVQKSAIEAGAGEWTVDPKTGEKSFQWRGREP